MLLSDRISPTRSATDFIRLSQTSSASPTSPPACPFHPKPGKSSVTSSHNADLQVDQPADPHAMASEYLGMALRQCVLTARELPRPRDRRLRQRHHEGEAHLLGRQEMDDVPVNSPEEEIQPQGGRDRRPLLPQYRLVPCCHAGYLASRWCGVGGFARLQCGGNDLCAESRAG